MKKLFFVFLTLTTLFSCNPDVVKDDIVGTWYLFSIAEQEVDDCQKQNELIFEENGDYTAKVFQLDDTTGNCVNEGEFNFTWSKLTNDIYTVTTPDGTTGSEIKFIDNNTALKINVLDADFIYKKKN